MSETKPTVAEGGKAPAGWARSPGDATQFLEELEHDISIAQPTIEAFEGHELTTEELEYEKHLCAALKRQATIELHPHKLRVVSWQPDGKGLGYVIGAVDREGRRYEAEFHYENLDRPDFAKRGDIGRAVLDDVIQGLLNAKQRYLDRMARAEKDLEAK